jgi:hypothetical protein
MLGESKAGAQSQSTAPSGAINAPVWQFERNAYSAIGGNGDGAAALCGRSAADRSALSGHPVVYERGRVCEGTGRFPHYLEEGGSWGKHGFPPREGAGGDRRS